jgi:hypothetical protein
VEDLTRDPATGGKAHLVVSSGSGGNTVAGDPTLAMTAPGSPGVIPTPETMDHLPLPDLSNAAPDRTVPDPIPVNWPLRAGESAPNPGGGFRDVFKSWTDTAGRPWAEK